MVITIVLAGCSSTASRMAECEAQGIAKDTCYLAEQNRQTAIYTVAEKQALENAAKQYAQAVKHKIVLLRDNQIVGTVKG